MALKVLQAQAQAKFEALRDQIQDAAEEISRNQIRDWEEQFPRHKFTIYQYHGMIDIEVTPPVFGIQSILNVHKSMRRGALATLAAEADKFAYEWNTIDFHLSIMDCEITAKEAAQ